MKRIYYSLLLAAVASAAWTCSDYEENQPARPDTDKRVAVSFTAVNPGTGEAPESRTSISIDDATKRFVSRWDDQDRMAMHYTCGSESGVVPATFGAAGNKFTASLPDVTGAWTYVTFSPYTDTPLKADGNGFQAPFGNHRTQQGSKFNYLFDPLVLKAPVSTSNAAPGKDDMGDDLTFDLARLTSILKYEIRGGSEPVKALLLTADKTISSSYYYGGFDGTGSYAANGTAEDAVPVESNVIALTFDGAAPTAADLDAYFNLPPAQYGNLTLDIITASNTMATLTLTDPAAADGGFQAGELYRLKADAPSFAAVAKPYLEWKDAQGGNMDLDASHEITVENGALTYPADIRIHAPAGIATLTVGIESEVLTPIVGSLDLIGDTHIPNPSDPSGAPLATFKALGLTFGKDVEYRKSTSFNIGNLVPMIMIYNPAVGTEHIFRVTVTDLAGNSTVQPITFTVPAPVVEPSIVRGTPNAWTNSVTFTLKDIPAAASVVKVQYKTTTETEWHEAEVSADRTTATAKPEWVAYTTADWTTRNAAAIQPYYRIKPNTGINKDNIYQYRMLIDDNEYTGTNFRAPTTVNNSIQTPGDEYLPCYEAASSNTLHASTTWCSGNNGTTPELCKYNATLNCARLKTKYSSILGFINVLAAGNLFYGEFNMGSTDGTVQFGQAYEWKARPKAVKIHYDAQVSAVQFVKHKNGSDYPIQMNEQDYARIFVAIVDWADTRKVKSGISAPTGTWDPETATETPDAATYGGGKIIGYASIWIDQATLANSLKEVTVPINYYDTQTLPSSSYTLVISCSSNAYGDFMCGGKENELHVGDFEWVY